MKEDMGGWNGGEGRIEEKVKDQEEKIGQEEKQQLNKDKK